MVGTLGAQAAMGNAWRGDVDPEARTELVTTGPFRYVRNPIFTATVVTAFGLALLVPNVLALAMLVAILASAASTGTTTSAMPRPPDASCRGSVAASRP